MTNVKITKRNLKPTEAQLSVYRNSKTIERARVPDLRFGKLAVATDADVDG